MARLPSFPVGTRALIEIRFFGQDDLPVTPASISCRIKPPSGIPQPRTLPKPVNGTASLDLVLSEEGTWRYIIETPEGAVHSGIILAESHPF